MCHFIQIFLNTYSLLYCNIADAATGFHRLLSQRNVAFRALAKALNTANASDCPQLKPFTLELNEHVTFTQEKVQEIKAMQSLDAPRPMPPMTGPESLCFT